MTGLNNVDDVCSTVDREQDKFIETTADSELDDDEIDEVFFTIKSKSSSPRVSKSDAEPGINESPNSKSNSTILRRTSKNSLNKQTSLKKFFTKQIPDKQHEHIQPMNESDSDEKKETEKDSDKYNDTLIDSPQSKKRAVLNSISFSDTFDLLSDEAESKVPDEVPLFIDSEPAHFTQPPRHSYKRKKSVCFDLKKFDSDDEFNSDDDGKKKKSNKKFKTQKKKGTKANKDYIKKGMQEWIKDMNKTFEEIKDYDLIIE